MKITELIDSFIYMFKKSKQGDTIAEESLKSKYRQETLIYTKRFVLEKTPSKFLGLDVRDFMRPSKTLKAVSGVKTFSSIMNERLKYIADNWSVKGYLDFWQFPEETDILKGGDCEDLSFYRIVNIISNNPEFRGYLFCALGFVKSNNKWIGHAFPVLWKNNELEIYEATANTDIKMDSRDYDIYYLFNDKYCFELKKGSFGTKRKLKSEFGIV